MKGCDAVLVDLDLELMATEASASCPRLWMKIHDFGDPDHKFQEELFRP